MKKINVNNNKTIIRRATQNDAKALISYLNKIGGESNFLTFSEGLYGKSVEEEEKFINDISSKENNLFIIAEINGEIVGNLRFTGGPRERTAHTGEFGVSVLKRYWGNRIGEKLIRYLISWSEEGEIIKKINLIVREDNKKAINLYKKLGFLEEGLIRRDFLIDDKFYDSLLMGLIID